MNKRNRSWKIIIAMLVILISAIIFMPLFFKRQIKNYLINEYNNSQNDFALKIVDLKPFLFTGSVKMEDIELKNVNTARPSALSSLKANSVTVNGVSFFRLLFGNGFHAAKVEIESPDIVMSTVNRSVNDSITDSLVIRKKLAIDLAEVIISNPHFSYFSNIDDTLPLIKTEHGNIFIGKFSVTDLKPGEQFSAKELWGELENIKYLTQDSLYTITLSKLKVSFSDSLLSVDSLDVIPNYSKKEFGKKAGKQIDRLTIHVSELKSTSFSAKSFAESKAISSELISIQSMSLEAYRDKNIERKIEYPPFLQQVIRDLDFPVDIKELKIEKGKVVYEELKEGNEKAGLVSFDNLKTTVRNISNQSFNDTMTVKTSCALVDNGSLNVKLSFPMKEGNNNYTCEGLLTGLQAKSLNSALPYLVGFSFKSGVIDTMKFDFIAMEKYASGNMQMNYHDLIIEAIDANTGKTKGGGKKILSFVLNNFVIKSDVPSARNKNNRSNLYYERDQTRFIFNNSLKTILSGVKKIVTGKND